jgi:glutaredoxin
MYQKIEEPSSITYTIYSKSGCPGCRKVKDLLHSENPLVIDCDEYLLEDKEGFLSFIQNLAKKPVKMFPIVFNKDKRFIGGYEETKKEYSNFNFDADF